MVAGRRLCPVFKRPVSWRSRSQDLGPARTWEGWRRQADAPVPEKQAEDTVGPSICIRSTFRPESSLGHKP